MSTYDNESKKELLEYVRYYARSRVQRLGKILDLHRDEGFIGDSEIRMITKDIIPIYKKCLRRLIEYMDADHYNLYTALKIMKPLDKYMYASAEIVHMFSDTLRFPTLVIRDIASLSLMLTWRYKRDMKNGVTTTSRDSMIRALNEEKSLFLYEYIIGYYDEHSTTYTQYDYFLEMIARIIYNYLDGIKDMRSLLQRHTDAHEIHTNHTSREVILEKYDRLVSSHKTRIMTSKPFVNKNHQYEFPLFDTDISVMAQV